MEKTAFLISKGVDINKSLELFGDIQTYDDTIGEFLVGITNKLAKLNNYKDNKDMRNYAIYVHSLKSDAKTFGFTKLANIAFEHEQRSKIGDLFYVYDNFINLEKEVNDAISIVKEYISGNIGISEEPKITKESTTSEENKYSKETILVVDDSNIIRNFVKRIFSDTYDVGTAKDGEEALSIIRSNINNGNIVAILLDLNMPNVDGFAVLDYMKENRLFNSIPVSIISGDSSKETIDRAFTYQIVDMLGKPFNDTDVKRVIEKTLFYKEMN